MVNAIASWDHISRQREKIRHVSSSLSLFPNIRGQSPRNNNIAQGYNHRYNKHRLLLGLRVKPKMAEQEGKRLIDCITKMRFLAVLAFVLAQNSSDQVLWKNKHTAKIFSIYLSELGKMTRNYPPIKVRMKWSLGPFKRFIGRNTLYLPPEMVNIRLKVPPASTKRFGNSFIPEPARSAVRGY